MEELTFLSSPPQKKRSKRVRSFNSSNSSSLQNSTSVRSAPPRKKKFKHIGSFYSPSPQEVIIIPEDEQEQQQEQDVEERIEDDIMKEILLRLCIKTLGKFNCVSKKWNNYISYDPYFRAHYKDVGRNATGEGSPHMLGIFYHCKGKIQFTPTNNQGKKTMLMKNSPTLHKSLGLGVDQTPNMVACSNGFLLCALEKFFPLKYYICIPITNQWISLPKPNKTSRYVATGFICKGSTDHNDLEYKVVRAILPEYGVYSNTLIIELLSTSTSCADQMQVWKEINVTCSASFHLDLRVLPHCPTGYDYKLAYMGTVISEETGCVYWPAYKEGSLLYYCLAFDPRKENSSQLEMIGLPEIGREQGRNYCFDKSHFCRTNGLIVYTLYNDQNLEMYMLDEHTKKWSLNYRVNRSSTHREIEALDPLNPHILLMKIKGEGRAWYNILNQCMDVVPVSKYGYCYNFFPYVWPIWPSSFLLFKYKSDKTI